MAVHLGHHDVADDETGFDTVDLRKGLTAVDTGVNVVVARQLGLEVVAYLVVVLGNHDAVAADGRLFHRRHLFLLLNRLRLFRQRHQCLLREIGLRDDLLRTQMVLAEGYGDHELTALVEVVDGDGAVVQLHERTGQVETDARARITVVGRGVGLIEALEDLLELVLGNLLTIVAHGDDGMLVVVGQADAYLSASRRVLEGVGEHVDDDLVEVGAVDPYGQTVAVVLEGEVDLP